MTQEDMIALVETYFAAVDGQDIGAVLATLSADCRFTVETHGVALTGQEQIAAMLHRLWDSHAAVRHFDFVHVPDAAHGNIASRFRVINTLPDGREVHKSNCNFFHVENGHFDTVAVYMAGENTLNRG